MDNESDIITYQVEDRKTNTDVKLIDDKVWLN